jgi:hypothetical protein
MLHLSVKFLKSSIYFSIYSMVCSLISSQTDDSSVGDGYFFGDDSSLGDVSAVEDGEGILAPGLTPT